MKVLVVDDQEVFRKKMITALTSEGVVEDAHVVQAGDGLEAIDAFEAHEDIVLMIVDIHMPRKNGVDTLRELNARHAERLSRTRIFIITTSNDPQLRQEMKGIGVMGWLVKPIDATGFSKMISKNYDRLFSQAA